MSDTPQCDELENQWTRYFLEYKSAAEVPEKFMQLAHRLERENAALREDKERLDWLQQHGHFGYVIGTKTADCWTVDLPLGEKTFLRAAIDAARKEQS